MANKNVHWLFYLFDDQLWTVTRRMNQFDESELLLLPITTLFTKYKSKEDAISEDNIWLILMHKT